MEKIPRKGSALYGMIMEDKEKTRRTLGNWKKLNKVVVFLYQIGLLPFMGVGWFIALLYTKGRRSGQTRITPLEYRKREGSIIIFAARGIKSDWYRNLKAKSDEVKLRIGFKTYKPNVELIDDPKVVRDYLRWYVVKFPRSSKILFGWDLRIDNVETTDFTSVAEIIKIVKLRLSS